MDLFRVNKLRKGCRSKIPQQESKDDSSPQSGQQGSQNGDMSGSLKAGPVPNMECGNDGGDFDHEDDDEFFTNAVKNKLKEARRNSFMVLIPEESSLDNEEEEEEGAEGEETSSSDWRDMDAEAWQPWWGFDGLYDKYCEQMLFFDRMSAQLLREVGSQILSNMSPRSVSKSASKKLASSFSCLSLKKVEEPQDEAESLQQPVTDPYQDLETAYVAQICLTWEALRCQYSQLCRIFSCHPENPICYSQCVQSFQQFQVLLQRFIENEPFEEGTRAEIYARARNGLPKLLQVPIVQGFDLSGVEDTEESDTLTFASDLIKIMEKSILTFHMFLKMEKNKPKSMVLNLFGGQSQTTTPLQLIQSSLEKKKMKLKELSKRKKKVGRNKSWPATPEKVELFFGLIDMKLISRVLRMVRTSREHLLWCEEKISSLDLSEGMLKRDPSPLFFPY